MPPYENTEWPSWVLSDSTYSVMPLTTCCFSLMFLLNVYTQHFYFSFSNACPQIQRLTCRGEKDNWASLWRGLGEGPGLTFALVLPQIFGFAHEWILFYWDLSLGGWNKLTGKEYQCIHFVCYLRQVFFVLRLHGKNKNRGSLKCLTQNFRSRQGIPAFLTLSSTVELQTNPLSATKVSYQGCSVK